MKSNLLGRLLTHTFLILVGLACLLPLLFFSDTQNY
jgi:hypothetical protein